MKFHPKKWVSLGVASVSLAGAMLALSAAPHAQAKGRGSVACLAEEIPSSPSDRSQTVTVKDHAAMDVYVTWQVVRVRKQCGNQVAEVTEVLSSGSKTLTAAASWSTSYDTANQALYLSVHSDANSHPYCWENQRMDASKGSVTLTVTGSLFGQSCNLS